MEGSYLKGTKSTKWVQEETTTCKVDTQRFTQRPCDKQRVVKFSVLHPKNFGFPNYYYCPFCKLAQCIDRESLLQVSVAYLSPSSAQRLGAEFILSGGLNVWTLAD